jgi:orotate phosphoribosyltransferase
VTLEHRAAPLVGDAILDLLDEHGLLTGPQAVAATGGLTMGADPVATAVMHRSAARGTPLDSFVVRKAAKQYGMGRRVEGPSVEGRRVIALEDTSTTGGSVLEAVAALREAGAQRSSWSSTATRAPRSGSRPRPGSRTWPSPARATWASSDARTLNLD